MSNELRLLFDFKKEIEIVSRNSPKDEPVLKSSKEGLTHNRDDPVIAIVFDLEPVSEDSLRLYKVDKN